MYNLPTDTDTGLIGEGRSISQQLHGDGSTGRHHLKPPPPSIKGNPSTANVALKSDAQILVMTLLWASQRRIGSLTSGVF
jgi:hypothetical protein